MISASTHIRIERSRNKIIEELNKDERLLSAAANNIHHNNHKSLAQDLLQELFLHLLELPESKFWHVVDNDYLFWYCIKYFSLQTGNNGKFNRTFLKKPYEDEWFSHFEELIFDDSENTELEIIQEEELEKQELRALENIQDILNNKLHWYDKRVFEFWLMPKATTRSLSKLWNIPAVSIHNTIFKVKRIIKDELYNNGTKIANRKDLKKGKKK